MHRVLRHIAVLLIYLMIPAAGEITENVLHLVTAGHMAHAVQDEAHQPDSPEHGCSGLVHVCGCHSSVSFIPAGTTFQVDAPAPTQRIDAWADEHPLANGHPQGVFRPPMT